MLKYVAGTDQTALVSIKDEKTHGIYRRPIANAYSLSSLKGYENYIDETIEKLMTVIDGHCKSGNSINMTRWLQFCQLSFHLTTLLQNRIYANTPFRGIRCHV